MSTPMQYYNSIPPVTKAYAVTCLLFTAASELKLYNLETIALLCSDIFKKFQVWRLVTPFFFLGGFSFHFAVELVTILLYGAQLERGPYDKRTADLVWMYFFGAISLLVMTIIPPLWSPFLGSSMIYVVIYNWSREFPEARINVYGLFEMKGFYLPWFIMVINTLFGNPIIDGLMGIAAGHLYYFLTVLYPLSSGHNIFKTPLWVHKLVFFWGKGYQMNSPYWNRRSEEAFRGRGHSLNGGRRTSSWSQTNSNTNNNDQDDDDTTTATPTNSTGDTVFRGRGRRLGDR